MELFTELMLKRGFLSGTYFYSSIAHTPKLIKKYKIAVNDTFRILSNFQND